jgi:hypothetical protein
VALLRDQGGGVTIRCRPRWASLTAALAIVLVTLLASSGAIAVVTPVPGMQGVDTSLPATDSQVTVDGRGPFASLAITVNQTSKLTNQAVSITWTGGAPTSAGVGRFSANFLQIMQCWGDDDGTHPENPGPPPEQCEWGAAGGTYAGIPAALFAEPVTISRVISRSSWANFDPNVGVLEAATGNVWLPFRSVKGDVVDIPVNANYSPFISNEYWLNPFFNSITTNEIPGATTGPDGKGAELFQVVTDNESAGLGCGRRVQPVPGGSPKTPKCWIVVVPRGDQAMENVGMPAINSGSSLPVSTSPVAPAQWQNRIAIPIDFKPLDSPCAFSNVDRQIDGNQMAVPAVTSWQAPLCGTGGLPPFSYGPVADGTARSLLKNGGQGSPGMVVVSRPLSAASVTAENPVVYAPLTVSGLVIGFNVERKADIGASDAMKQLEGVRVAELNLTPRLVAKLLTQSYTNQVNIRVRPSYPWLATNPANLSLDPDFRQFNPEFNLMFIGAGRTFSGLQLPAGNSDAAQQLWEWVFADPEALAWLNGAPDPWGMVVNPWYSATAASNPSGIAFGDPLPLSFPKADPYCYQAPAQGPGGSIVPPLLCGTDWMPYTRDFLDSARITRIASDGAKIVPNPVAEAPSAAWTRVGPQYYGDRALLAVTDTTSASQYGVQMARLSRAGDDGADRSFVAPDTAGLVAGVASLAARDVSTFLEPAPSTTAPGAYPLTSITYAAIAPLRLDAQARSDYAAFLDYAGGPGQVPGFDVGQLPSGYAPLPPSLQAQTAAAANLVRTMQPEPEPTTTTTSTTTSPAPTDASSPPPSSPKPRSKPSTAPSTATTSAATTTAAETTTTTALPATAPATTVVPTSTVAPTTTTVVTAGVRMAKSRLAVPGVGIVALGSALGALEITKRPRRRARRGADGSAGSDPFEGVE